MPKGKPKRSWLMTRWSEMFQEATPVGAFTTGRADARADRVRRFKVGPGLVVGVVASKQDYSTPQPRRVTLELPTYDEVTWERIIAMLHNDMTLVLRMIGGELPAEMDVLVTAAGGDLLPRLIDMALSCSYDGQGMRCKHTVALAFTLALAAEQDPFVLFALRGQSKAQLLAALGFDSEPDPGPPLNPLPADYRDFWRMDEPFVALETLTAPFERKPATLMQLSLAQLTPSGDLGDQLLPLYQRVSEYTLRSRR